MKRRDDGTPICPQGHLFELEKMKVDTTGTYLKTEIHYRNKNCEDGSVRTLCTKEKKKRNRKLTKNQISFPQYKMKSYNMNHEKNFSIGSYFGYVN